MRLSKKISFLASYTVPIIIPSMYYFTGGVFGTFAGVATAYLLIPLFDQLIGRDPHNVLKEEFDELIQTRYFDVLVYSHVYIQYSLLLWGGYVLVFDGLSAVQAIGLVLSLGVYASSIINVAHELGHRPHPVAQLHARLALLSVSYMHFIIEHNRGHHVHVATPRDPATSRKNQSVYSFWRQSILGGYRSAWRLEVQRLERLGKPALSPCNEMIIFGVAPWVLVGLLTLVFSLWAGRVAWIVPVYFIAQSIIAILSLECVNYIEHYGIVRREVAPGRYERVNPLHSWNANHFLSNLLLFQLQRHSDHHAFAARPYQVLRHFDQSPQLPFGYPVMILMSLLPPLWFGVMNARLEVWQRHACDADRINAVVRQFA